MTGHKGSRLGEFVTLQRGTTYKSALLDLPGPYLFGLASIQRHGGFRRSSLRTYGGDSDGRYLLGPGDLFVSLKDVTQSAELLGAVARVPSDIALGRLTQDTAKLQLTKGRATDADKSFIYWLLRTPDYREYCRAHSTGTTNLGLPREDFLSFELPPPTPARVALVMVLDQLEKKIELNRRLNETLEETARTLFKSWFVDFDPVRAKAEGRKPLGMDAATAALFPDGFEHSELGEVPRGWSCRALAGWASALSGGTPSKANPALWGGDIPWISPKVMTEIHADDAEAFVTPAAIGNGTRVAPSGSTLVMVRGMGLHERVRVSQARRDVTFNQDVKALVPSGIEATLLLFALLHGQAELLGRVQSSGHGTGVLPSDILLGHTVSMPEPVVQRSLVRTFDPLNDRIEIGRRETRTLAELRDYLLPKLLSGEVRVRDAEKLVGESV